MKTFNSYFMYAYIPLGIALVIVIAVFLSRLGKLMKNVTIVSEDAGTMGNHLENVKKKTGQISASADSWKFFASLSVIFILIKELFKGKKDDKSLGKTVASTLIRHSGQLKKVKF